MRRTTRYKKNDYLEGRVSRDAYYGQFIDGYVLDLVRVGFGERLEEVIDDDHSFALTHEWEQLAEIFKLYYPGVMISMKLAGGSEGVDLAERVEVLKAAARRIRG